MAQTNLDLARLRNYVSVSLDDGSVHSDLDQDEIINLAGRLFFSSHPWNFRYRPPIKTQLTADQSYIELPEDFGELVAYQTDNNYGLQLTTPQAIANLRVTSVTVTQNYYWGTLIQPAQSARNEPPPPMRLEIWPAPASTTVDAVHLWYRADWVDLYNDDDVADIPKYAHGALIQFVRGYAVGLFENLWEPSGGIEGWLERVVEGVIWKAAVEKDGLVQPDYGPMTGGAIEMHEYDLSWRSRTASAVADPS